MKEKRQGQVLTQFSVKLPCPHDKDREPWANIRAMLNRINPPVFSDGAYIRRNAVKKFINKLKYLPAIATRTTNPMITTSLAGTAPQSEFGADLVRW